jgi:hypothetical protein
VFLYRRNRSNERRKEEKKGKIREEREEEMQREEKREKRCKEERRDLGLLPFRGRVCQCLSFYMCNWLPNLFLTL